MTRRQQIGSPGWLLGALVGGTALAGGMLWALIAWPRPRQRTGVLPSDTWQTHLTFTEADVEAAARMLASENPRGSQGLHIEQIWTQIRACKPGQSLFERITAGSGWGVQGKRTTSGMPRPVSTQEPATDAQRQLAREVLVGLHPSVFHGARKFFEPAQQDRAFAMAESARQKRAAGKSLSPQELRLLGYRRTADQVRRKWIAEGSKRLGTIEGIEFYE